MLCFPGASKCINARKVAFLRPDIYTSIFPHRHLAASQSSGPDGDQRMASQRVSVRVFSDLLLVHNHPLYLFTARLNEVSVGGFALWVTGSQRSSVLAL